MRAIPPSKHGERKTLNYTCTRCRSCPGGRVFLGARCHFVCRFQTRASEMLLQPVSTDRAMDAMSRELYTLPARNGRHTHVGWYRRGLQPPVCARGCGAALGMRPYCVLEAAVAQWYSEKTSGLRSTMPLCWHHEDCSAHSEGERVSQKACRPDATSWRTALNMRRE